MLLFLKVSSIVYCNKLDGSREEYSKYLIAMKAIEGIILTVRLCESQMGGNVWSSIHSVPTLGDDNFTSSALRKQFGKMQK